VVAREDGLTNRLSLSSPSRTLVTPYCKCIHSGAGQHEAAGFPPLCSVSRQPIWAGARSDNLLVGPGTPRGRNADTHTHTHIYIYIYIYICLCLFIFAACREYIAVRFRASRNRRSSIGDQVINLFEFYKVEDLGICLVKASVL
jgi:hypothetical protein